LVNGTHVEGWACEYNVKPAVEIHFYFGTRSLATDVGAAVYGNGMVDRPDVRAAIPQCRCTSSCGVGFSFILHRELRPQPALAWALAGLNRCVNGYAITTSAGNPLLGGSGRCAVIDVAVLNPACDYQSWTNAIPFAALTKDSGVSASTFNASHTGELRARAIVRDYVDGTLDLSLACLPVGKSALADLRIAGSTLHDTFKIIVRRMSGEIVVVGPPSSTKTALAPLPRRDRITLQGVPNEQLRVEVYNVPLEYYATARNDFNTSFTFLGRSVPMFSAVLDVNCRCRHTKALTTPEQLASAYDLKLSNNLNGQLQFDFATPFSCLHLSQVAFRRMGQVSATTEKSQTSTGGCDSRAALTSEESFVRGLAAATRHTALVQLSTTKAQNSESMTLEQAFVVPLDIRFEVQVLTERQSPIRNRAVTVTVRSGLADTLQPQLFAPFDSATSVRAHTISGVTNNDGLLTVRVLIAPPSEIASAPQTLTIVAAPAAMSGALTLTYGGCDVGVQPCSQTVQLAHEDGVTSARRRLTFTDKTVVTLTGKVRFAGGTVCAADDVVVQAFEAPFNPSVLPIAEAEASADGSFSFVVLQSLDLVVQVKRKKSPQYVFVDAAGAAVVNRFAVAGATNDAVLTVPFFAAAAVVGGVGVLPTLTLPIVGGTCGLPLAAAARQPRLTLKSPACPGELQLVGSHADASPAGFAGVQFSAVPPLLFDVVSLDDAASDARVAQFFASQGAARTVDARLPLLDDKSGMTPTRVARDARTLQSLLGADLLLHLPLDSSLIDRAAVGHEAAATTSATLAHAKPDGSLGGQLQIAFNSSAIGLGRPPTLDAGGALTFASWLVVEMPVAPGVATLFSLRSTNANAPTDALLVRINQAFSSYTLDVQHNGAVVAGPTTALSYGARVHVAVTVADGAKLVLTVHDASGARQQLPSAANQSFRRRSLASCSERFQYDCVREVTIGAERNFEARERALFRGALDDVGLWARVLSDNDVSFIVAAGLDGVGLDKLANVLPRYVFRAPLQIELPANERRVFSQEKRLGVGATTLDQVLQGVSAAKQRCSRRSADRQALEAFDVHPVRQSDAVGLLAHVFETYNGVRCYRVAGEVTMRSTFTDACREISGGAATQPVSSCQLAFGPSSWGYKSFFGVVSAPKMLPAKTSRLLLEEKTASELSLFVGEFGMTVKSPFFPAAPVQSETLYFVTSGVAAPPNPAVFAYPASDVPLLRLHRPPGDQSSAFLERSWAQSTTLSLGLTNNQRIGARVDVEGKVGVGIESQTCVGAAGGPIVALLTSDYCIGLEAHAWVGASLGVGGAYTRSESRSLANMFSASVLQRFETAVNEQLVGKDGDVVVTMGLTILVSDAFLVRWEDAPACAINATYAPEWEPADEMRLDTLQITSRAAVPPQIADWQRQIGVLLRDCNATRATFDGLLWKPRSDIQQFAAANCKLADRSTPTAEQAKAIGGKIDTAMKGEQRWTAIKKNWDSLLCAAIKAVPRDDYYAALEGREPCSSAAHVGTPSTFSVGSTTALNKFDPARKTIDYLSSLSSTGLCGAKVGQSFLGVSLASVSQSAAVDPCGPQSPQTAVPQLNKLTYNAPAVFSYAATSESSATETYEVANGGDFTTEASVEAGASLSALVEFEMKLKATLTVEVGFSASRGFERSAAEATSVGFTLSDDDVGDQIAVSIFEDPVFAVPVFVTTGGYTSCPCEPGTNCRQEIRVTPATRAPTDAVVKRSTSADEELVLDLSAIITSQRAQDATFDYVLSAENEDDLKITYKGVALAVGQNPTVTLSNSDVRQVSLSVKRGRRFSYPLVRVTVASACDGSVVQGVLFNLTWASQCAPVAIDTTAVAGATSLFATERPFFVVNARTAATALVPVINPDAMNSPWSLVDGKFSVKLQYRAVGEQTVFQDWPLPASTAWPEVNLCKNTAAGCFASCAAATPRCCKGFGETCTAAAPCCDNVGLVCRAGVCNWAANESSAIASVDTSKLSNEEGAFELRAVSTCGALSTNSAVVRGRIDRVPPRLFGAVQEPADGIYFPGDSIAFRFVEPLECARPFSFALQALVEGGATPAISNDVDVICQNDRVEIAFGRTLVASASAVIGKVVTLRLTGVRDAALNEAAAAAEWRFLVGAFDVNRATVSLSDVRVPLDLFVDDGISDLGSQIARALAGNSALQLNVTVGAASTRRRQAARSVDVRIAAPTLGSNTTALDIAAAILKRTDVDTRASRVVVATPEMQAAVTRTFPPDTTSGAATSSGSPVSGAGAPESNMTAVWIGVGVGVGVAVLLAIGLVVGGVVVHRKKKRASRRGRDTEMN
jgi:hypothetical protein